MFCFVAGSVEDVPKFFVLVVALCRQGNKLKAYDTATT